ncbi:MAG: hypothetical protein ACKVTZ_14595 [Bacteroidia bacterium]
MGKKWDCYKAFRLSLKKRIVYDNLGHFLISRIKLKRFFLQVNSFKNLQFSAQKQAKMLTFAPSSYHE